MSDTPVAIEYCPKCELPLGEQRALSRVDNISEVCPDCGTKEAMESFYLSQLNDDEI
jgi:hypothetical protein